MTMSPRTILELLTGVALAAALAWLGLTLAWTRTDLAKVKTQLKTKDLIIQAHEVTSRSCQAALGRVQLATTALGQATESAYAQTQLIAQAAASRDPALRQTMDRLLRIRAPEGQDCQAARGLAQAAWEEGQ